MFSIPLDIYESPSELVIIMPLAGVRKESLVLSMQEYRLIIKGERIKPDLKDDLTILQEDCFWGSFEQKIDLPASLIFHDIHSVLSRDNILTIILPKVRTPEQIKIQIE